MLINVFESKARIHTVYLLITTMCSKQIYISQVYREN